MVRSVINYEKIYYEFLGSIKPENESKTGFQVKKVNILCDFSLVLQ